MGPRLRSRGKLAQRSRLWLEVSSFNGAATASVAESAMRATSGCATAICFNGAATRQSRKGRHVRGSVSRVARQLQWGRDCVSRGKRLDRRCCSQRRRQASMGPRLCQSRKGRRSLDDEHSMRCSFNGAATASVAERPDCIDRDAVSFAWLQWGRDCVVAESMIDRACSRQHRSALQWGRDCVVAERSTQRRLHSSGHPASMGPRLRQSRKD